MGERTLAYAVLPLTMIAIDMIIATLPLAGLLVEMVIQAYSPGVHVDPLLAKNIVWFFGHPVVVPPAVPAVAVYYLLIPRYAGRPLVAGELIARVAARGDRQRDHLGAPHLPGLSQASIQGTLEHGDAAADVLDHDRLGAEPLQPGGRRCTGRTSSGTRPRASSSPGCSVADRGPLWRVVNATISLDVAIHNTLWIVGHFHQIGS